MAQIPSQVRVLDSDITITEGGRAKILQKYNSLTRSPKHYQEYAQRCNTYFPIIQEAMKEHGVPSDFKYLALQESALRAEAVSRSMAVGYWQFKIATARERLLRVDGDPDREDVDVDERMNIYNSSHAAAVYLKRNAQYLNGSWIYALLSYNLGLTGCKNYIRDNRLNPMRIVVDENTHHYIIHFLAHYFAFGDSNIENKPPYLVPMEFVNTTFSKVSTTTGTPIENLQEYNKWLKNPDKIIPNDKIYSVVVPANSVDDQEVLMALSTSFKEELKGTRNTSAVYVPEVLELYPFIMDVAPDSTAENRALISVNGLKAIYAQKGDTPEKLAQAGEISEMEFLAFNYLTADASLEEGAFYYLEKSPDEILLSTFHIWEEGDTQESIAKRYGISLEGLRKLNGLKEGEQRQKIFFSRN
ncbi:hypothetical protein GCM10023331_11530 [Algivirga pacifica]|uniref:LysM domain-containing protein n=1 Tax=Algivirga pacifica TaxID=1162670 RepID=A0ABP9D9Y6_9BACT